MSDSSISSISIKEIQHSSSGASIKIHPLGATILSYIDGKTGHENLFVSDTAILDGTKPIRGGIPIVFPIFGPPPDDNNESTMPQHGFARRNLWTELKTYDDETSAGAIYELQFPKNVVDGRGTKNLWGEETTNDDSCPCCTLELHVDFTGDTLTTKMIIKNTSTSSIVAATFPFQALLHTYYAVSGNAALDGSQCYVQGLEGYTCKDKVTKEDEYVLGADPITISCATDRVYTPPPTGTTLDVNVTIGVGNGKTLSLTASSTVNGIHVPTSCVVWNPFKEGAESMSDFGNTQYHDMICVEPGILSSATTPDLAPGNEACLTQIIKV